MSRMPLLWFSFSFIAGILIAASVSLTAQIWLLLAGLAAVLRFTQPLIKKRLSKYIPAPQQTPDPTQTPLPRWPVSLPLAFCILCLGAARYQSSLPQVHPGFIAAYNDTETEMAITGTIVHPPDFRDRYTNLRVAVERAREENSISYTGVSGLLLARVPPHGDWHYGDRVVLHGMLQTPPESEEFSYREYLARQGVYTLMPFAEASLLEAGQGNPIYTAVFAFKQRALEMVYRLFPDPEASLLAGILLGVESGISTEVADAFSDTGTTHIIAISGFNMTIIAGLFVSLFGRWLGPRRGAILAAFGIAVYTFLVGADPAVVRAAIMGGFALLARQVGRRQQAINTLVFTAALMSFFNPHLPWDVGFQLSIAATLGLVLYAEPLKQWFVRLASRQIGLAAAERLAVPVGDYFLFTVAAQITTLPVILYHFQRLSLSSLPANLAILPAQPPIMVAGGLAVLFAMLYLPLGQLVAFFAWPFAVYTIRMVEWFARWRGGVLVLGETSLLVVT
ncbi:MAG: ComEC family competence protein, partial [Anaerolineae bacterium]|nr:ComEC family competence protein [Anaerolineae bacterium]